MGSRYRHENKYRLDACQAAVLEMRAAGLLKADWHTGADGTYLIKSLYFDDYHDNCFQENEAGCDRRYKFRIRYYDNDVSCIRLEKKSKLNGMTRKESCLISEAQCREFMSGKIPSVNQDMPKEMQSLFTQMRLENMLPKVIVIYERKPYVCTLGNVRVTFDRKLQSSNDIAGFLEENVTSRPIFQTGESLMEVKWDELLPGYIREGMELDSLQWTSFSKYYLCRKYNSYGGERI